MFNLKRIFGRDRNRTLFECRRCGKTVEADTETCPECGADDIIRFDL